MESTDIKYEYLRKEHCNGLRQLYKNVFGKKVDENYFVIKYGLEFRNLQFSSVAILNGVVIGFHGAILYQFTRDNSPTQNNLHTCDFMLISEFRGKGVFQKLYQMTLDMAKEHGVDHLYAFQSDQTYKICKRLGWEDEMGFSRFHIKNLMFSNTKLIRILGLSNWRNKRLSKFCKKYEVSEIIFFKGNSSKYQQNAGVEFLKMKDYAQRKFLIIDGCAVWIKYDHFLTIGYVALEENSNIESMLGFVKELLKKCWIHEAVFHVHNASSLIPELEKYSTKKPSFKVSSLALNKSVDSFSELELHFMNMDVF